MCSSRSNSIIYHRPDLGRTLHVPYSPYTHGALIPTQFRDWFSTSKCHKAEPVLRLGPSSHEYHTVLDHAPYHLHGLARTYRLSSVDGRVRLVAVSLSLYTTYTYISCLLCRRFFFLFFFLGRNGAHSLCLPETISEIMCTFICQYKWFIFYSANGNEWISFSCLRIENFLLEAPPAGIHSTLMPFFLLLLCSTGTIWYVPLSITIHSICRREMIKDISTRMDIHIQMRCVDWRITSAWCTCN